MRAKSLQSSALVLIAGFFLFFSSPVRADFAVEGPFPGNSEFFDTLAFSFPDFNLVAVFAVAGTLEPGAFTNFGGVLNGPFGAVRLNDAAPSWSQVGSNGPLAVATGDLTSNLAFNVNFVAAGGLFDVAVFAADGTILGSARIGENVFIPFGWTHGTRGDVLGAVAVPTPRSSLLAIIGLGFVGLGLVGRRFN